MEYDTGKVVVSDEITPDLISPESINITFLVLEIIIPVLEYLLYKKFAKPVSKKGLYPT